MMIHRFPVRVYIEDTDVGGIVYYVNYLKYMERARTELLRSLGYQQQALKEQGLLFVVHSLNAGYRQSARLDDELIVETTIERMAAASLVFKQRVLRSGDKVLLSTAEVRVAAVATTTMKPVPLPAALATALRAYLGNTETTNPN